MQASFAARSSAVWPGPRAAWDDKPVVAGPRRGSGRSVLAAEIQQKLQSRRTPCRPHNPQQPTADLQISIRYPTFSRPGRQAVVVFQPLATALGRDRSLGASPNPSSAFALRAPCSLVRPRPSSASDVGFCRILGRGCKAQQLNTSHPQSHQQPVFLGREIRTFG